MEKLQLLGLGAVCLGILIFAGYALYSLMELFLSAAVHPLIKAGIVCMVLGVIIILISLVWERYREVRKLGGKK